MSQVSQAAVYVFGDGKTTTFVGADDMAYPVLGYVDNPNFSVSQMPPNMAAWLDEYARQIAWARKQSQKKERTVQDQLETPAASSLMNESGTRPLASSKKRISVNISPMLTTQWDQTRPTMTSLPC